MNTIVLNTIRLFHKIATIGEHHKKIIRYVPDNEIPDTHIEFCDIEGIQYKGADDTKFYGKKG